MEHFEDAAHLLAYTNHYLDEAGTPKSAEEARERAQHILFLISEMRRFNFHAPKFGIKDLFRELRFADKEELLEAMPFLRKMMYSLNIRKWTYERAKIAYLSHRLAYFSLKYEGLVEFLPFLPYSGEYLSFTEKGGGASYLAFRDLEKLLKGEKRIEVTFQDETFQGVEKRGKKGVLPSSTATLLASTSVSFVLDEAIRRARERERREIENLDDVEEYQRIVSRYDITKLEENPEYLWRLLQELEEAGFLEEDATVREDVLQGLKRRRAIWYNEIFNGAQMALSRFLTEYYLFFPRGVRREKPPLRGMPEIPGPLEHFLVPFRVGECVSTSPRRVLKEFLEVEEIVGIERTAVARHILNTICPSLGERSPTAEELLNSLRRSERARRFLELAGRDKDDKDKG